MKKLIKALSVISIGSPLSTIVSCSSTSIEKREILFKGTFDKIGKIEVEIKEPQVSEVSYETITNKETNVETKVLTVKLREKDSIKDRPDPIDYLRFKGTDNLYRRLLSIQFELSDENDWDDDFERDNQYNSESYMQKIIHKIWIWL